MQSPDFLKATPDAFVSGKALVVVDMQNEWQEKLSSYYLGDISRLVVKQNKLIDYCRSKGYRIIFTAHVENEGEEFKAKTGRSRILRQLHRQKGDALVKKAKVSPFYKTTLEKKLAGISTVIVCGVLTNLCVRSAVEGLTDRDKHTILIEDACKTFDFEVHAFTLKDLKDTRDELLIMKTDELILKKY